MAARKSREPKINLLPQEEFAASTIGRILRWILSTFRIIVIVTEMVVMIAFLSRFWLDARITDLNEIIRQRQAVITAYAATEKTFVSAQEKLKVWTALTPEGRKILPTLQLITADMPGEISLVSFSQSAKEAQIKAQSPSEQAVAQFIANLEGAQKFQEVSLAQISADQSGFLVFSLKANLK